MGLKDLGEKALESKFICGLKDEIQSEMRKLNPLGIKAKMTMAQLIEEDQIIQHGDSKGKVAQQCGRKIGFKL